MFFSVPFTTISSPVKMISNFAKYNEIFVAFSLNLLIRNTSSNDCKQEKRSQLYTFNSINGGAQICLEHSIFIVLHLTLFSNTCLINSLCFSHVSYMHWWKMTYRIYSINHPGRLFNFGPMRVGTYLRWVLI